MLVDRRFYVRRQSRKRYRVAILTGHAINVAVGCGCEQICVYTNIFHAVPPGSLVTVRKDSRDSPTCRAVAMIRAKWKIQVHQSPSTSISNSFSLSVWAPLARKSAFMISKAFFFFLKSVPRAHLSDSCSIPVNIHRVPIKHQEKWTVDFTKLYFALMKRSDRNISRANVVYLVKAFAKCFRVLDFEGVL